MSETKHEVIALNLIDRPEPPVREHLDHEEIESLCRSIRQNGVLVPLLVRPKGERYEIIDGDRRREACIRVGLSEVSCVVRNAGDSETHALRMLANLDRENPDPVSEAKYIASAIQTTGQEIEQFAKLLGRGIKFVEDRLTIAEMPDYMHEGLRQKKVSLGVAIALFSINNENARRRYFLDAVDNGMTVQGAVYVAQTANDTIERLEQAGTEKPEQYLPSAPPIPKAECAITGDILPLDELRLVRVSKKALNAIRNELSS